jgi:hypothetical protein
MIAHSTGYFIYLYIAPQTLKKCNFFPQKSIDIRGVLGNKCAGQHNFKTVHFREKLASGTFLAWSSAIRVFFCSPQSTLERQRQAFM